jgi:hypothetical protein
MTDSQIKQTPSTQSTPVTDPVSPPSPAPDSPTTRRDLVTINIDLPSAIATAVGALPRIMGFRAQAAALPGFDASAFDQLETYTFATGVAHSLYMSASAQPAQLIALNEQAMTLRTTLYADAVALSTRGLISGDRIAEFKANIGYKNLAFDLLALSGLLRQSWSSIAGKTAITTADLDQADLLCDQLMDAVGTREQAPVVATEASMQRQRHFTLFVKAYDQVRRAISYLRWDEDDLEQIAPSLYIAGRASGRKKTDSPDPTPAPGPTPPTSPAPAVSGTNAASAPAAAASTNTAPATALKAGHPGGSPFAGVS